MWIVEFNVLGRRFTHQVRDHREDFRDRSRTVQSRLSTLRRPGAAA
jgi:hypothetical protein